MSVWGHSGPGSFRPVTFLFLDISVLGHFDNGSFRSRDILVPGKRPWDISLQGVSVPGLFGEHVGRLNSKMPCSIEPLFFLTINVQFNCCLLRNKSSKKFIFQLMGSGRVGRLGACAVTLAATARGRETGHVLIQHHKRVANHVQEPARTLVDVIYDPVQV